MGQYQNPGNPVDCNILLTSKEEILLQASSHQYNAPPESTPTTSEVSLATAIQLLMIPRPYVDPAICIHRISLQRNVNNPQAREAQNCSLVDELAQYLTTMSILEVLQTYPNQRKSLLSSLGVVEPTDTRLITFDLDCWEPCLPTLVSFHIPVNIRKIMVHQCIIDEVASCPNLYGRNFSPLS
jgi:hypothetical protein